MLVDFEVENFRSYREAKRLSMVASSARELPENLIDTDLGFKIVRTAVIYGPNASGKSNLLLAMNYLSKILSFPEDANLWRRNIVSPFLLEHSGVEEPSRFRVRFLLENILYDYSIAVRGGVVDEERLIAYPHGRPREWFHRSGRDIEFNATYLKGQKQSLRALTPADAPLLSVAVNYGHPQLAPIGRWLASNLDDRFNPLSFRVNSLSTEPRRANVTAEGCARDPLFHAWANRFLRYADLGISDIEVEVTGHKYQAVFKERPPDGGMIEGPPSKGLFNYDPYFVHASDRGKTMRLGIEEESDGTRRLFSMLIPLFNATHSGRLMVADELGASLHPSLVREIVRAFHDPELNPKGSQLVFATHDASLLSGQLFRRDQVWFTEKDASGATDLYSLNDIQGVREDESIDKGYLRGRYGAIPFFGSFDFPAVSDEPAEAAT